MKYTLVLSALCAVLISSVIATPVDPKDYKNIEIVALESDIEDGKYHFSFENDDDTRVDQTGEIKIVDEEHGGPSVVGSYSYKGDDGKDISLTYTADETGYHPKGDHLPVGPPVPEAIARALRYLATAPTTEATKIIK